MLRNHAEFWMTTGLFPQEVVIRFEQPVSMEYLKLACHNGWSKSCGFPSSLLTCIFLLIVREVQLESCSSSSPSKWEMLSKNELSQTQDCLQIEPLLSSDPGVLTKYLKLSILSGYDDFCLVQQLSLQVR